MWGVGSSPSLPLCHPCQCQDSSVRISGSGPDGLEAGRIPASLGPSVGLCLPTVCSAQAGLFESSFDWAPVGSGGAIVATEEVVRRPFVPVGRRTTWASAGVEITGAATRAEVPLKPRDPLAL